MEILIVDDDKICLSMVEENLTKAGHKVQTASNGREAWKILEKGDIRLVITDWYMPHMDGVELCKKIRAADFPEYVYIILLTSHDQKEDILIGLSAGADDYIGKPFDPAELNLRIQIGERILSLETRNITIFALAKLAESRDTETGLHLERMCNYSKIIATELSKMDKYKDIVTPDYIHNIYLTSPMHDIGKVAIPDSVLLKPDRLTDEEWKIMKIHSEKGAETLGAALKRFPGIAFLEIARDIAWCHHEKYDGSGYEKIPLSGRIVALADVYDALTTKRVYKKAFTPYVARSIIKESAGKHFDPDITEVFLSNEASFIEILKRNRK
jgi:putative two-component system response regulator